VTELADYYHYYAETSFSWNGITQENRNPLLYLGMGVDGLKTGHTEESGYGLVSSGVRDGRRLILAVNGLGSERERAEESQRILEWGFREFKTYPLYAAGAVVDNADVWQGVYGKVPLVVDEDVNIMITRDARRDLKVKVAYQGPLTAPITAGSRVGLMTITAPNMPTRQVPLLAGSDVEQEGLLGRAIGALQQMIIGG